MSKCKSLDEQRKGCSSWMLFPENCKYSLKRPERRQRRLNTELLKAVEEGDVHKVNRCLEQGASSNATCAQHKITASHLAALAGNYDIILVLCKWGADLRTTDSEGRTPMHLAAWNGNVDCLRKILEITPENVNAKAGLTQTANHVVRDNLDSWNHDHDFTRVKLPRLENGSSSLHVACQKLHAGCVKLLLDFGADKDSRDNDGMSPLDAIGEKVIGERLQYADKPFLQVFQIMTNAGAKLSLNTSNFRTTPMHTAMLLEQVDAIPVIASSPYFVLGPDHTGASPLHFAVTHRLEISLRVLLQNSISTADKKISNITDIDLKDCGGNTPLHLAVISQWRPGVGIFLEAGADTCEKNSDGATVVHLAAEIGNHDILEEILNVPESKCVLNSADLHGDTPIFKAILGRSASCVKLLLDAGARLRPTRSDKMTVMHAAAQSGTYEVLEELVRRDHNSRLPMFNQTDSRGMTPLHLACTYGHTLCVKVLLSAGCNSDTTSNIDVHTNCTPLHLASAQGHHEVVELLLSSINATKIVNSKDDHGCTPLHLACQNGHRECIRILLLSGADLSAKVKRKRTTAMELLFRNISQPIAFLETILDSNITINEYSVNDPKCVITVDYRVLVPRDKCNKQMKVLDALFDTGMSSDQECLVLHPVVESFLFLKWRNWRTWFFYSFFIYLMFLIGFTIMVITLYYVNEKDKTLPVWLSQFYCKIFVYITLFWLVSAEIQSAWRLPRYYFVDLDSWLKWSSYILAATVTGIGEDSGDWHRAASCVAIIMVWAELMFQMSRNPNWGYYINMFSKVAMNVCRVLGTFVFLLIGFSLAFMILYKAKEPFDSPWAAFVKTSTMMTTDFDYSSLFDDNENLSFPIFGHIIFMVFLLSVSIILMNLMIGIAVSDIADLETRGKMNRLRKQADFLRVIQPSDKDMWCMPKWSRKRKPEMLKIQPPIEIRPGNPQCKMMKTLPKHVVDAIVDKALQQRKSGKCTVQELYNKLNEVISLSARSEKLGSGYNISEIGNEAKLLEQILKEVFYIKNIVQGLQISLSKDFRVEV